MSDFNNIQNPSIIDFLEKKIKVDGAILFLDFNKVFNSLECFMFESLKKMVLKKNSSIELRENKDLKPD